MNFLKASYNWLVISSVDPNQYAMTIKGAAVLIVPAIIILGKHFGYGWSDTELAQVFQEIGVMVGAALTAFGIIRKLLVSSVDLYHYIRELLKK